MTCICGIDPGLSGALAFFWPTAPDRCIAEDLPTTGNELDCATIAARLQQMSPDLAVIERVHSFPGQGLGSTFRFGQTYGSLLGILAALRIRVVTVPPITWKKHFKLSADKELARRVALQTFAKTSEFFNRKRDHNRAEAAPIAVYGAAIDSRNSGRDAS